jgi:acetate kinase
MSASPTTVLTFNGGSSSLKFGLFDVRPSSATVPLVTGAIERCSAGMARLQGVDHAHGPLADRMVEQATAADWPELIIDVIERSGHRYPAVLGHRVVHGGPRLLAPVLIDADVLAQLDQARGFAPLHIPQAIATIGAAQRRFPDCPHVACFDTGFHTTMPAIAATLPLPAELRDAGIRRYGFHGLSCESIVGQLGNDLPARLIIAHLGNGASVTAVKDGASVDTSMGLTPTGGIIMGQRSGDLDPGILLHLMREHGHTAPSLETLLDRRSGLLGISGIDSDMRRLNEAAPDHPAARLAIAMFCRSLGKGIAAMAHVLGGVDLIVFTGGIGEHDHGIRAVVAHDLGWIGAALDEKRNRAGAELISSDGSTIAIRVMPSREDAQIAAHSAALIHRE